MAESIYISPEKIDGYYERLSFRNIPLPPSLEPSMSQAARAENKPQHMWWAEMSKEQ